MYICLWGLLWLWFFTSNCTIVLSCRVSVKFLFKSITWTGSTLQPFVSVPSQDLGFQRFMSWSFFVFSELRWYVIDCVVDIGSNCWPSLLRGDCLCCWYWFELLTITVKRWLFVLVMLVRIVHRHCLNFLFIINVYLTLNYEKRSFFISEKTQILKLTF